LFSLSRKENIEDLYHNFTTTLSYSINKFSIKVLSKKGNRRTNHFYDKEYKKVRREIKESIDESLKVDNINWYKALIKREKKVIYN